MKPRLPLLVSLLSCSLLCFLALVTTGCGSDTHAGNRLFHQSRDFVKEGQFESGKQGFVDYLKQHPNGPHTSRARFFIAKCELGLGDLDAARAAFKQCQRDYPNSDEADKSVYKLAFIELLEGNEDAALAILRASPDSTLAPEATALIRNLESSSSD
ncbi:MAG: tetratricopeptide repeat protein [Opitutaceae bacterium]